MRNHSPIRILIALVACTISIGSSFADEPLKKLGQKSENELRTDAENQCQNGQFEELLKTCKNLVRLVESRDSAEQTCEIEDFVAALLIQANQLKASARYSKRSWILSESHLGKDHWQTVSRRWSLDYVQKLQAAPTEAVRQLLQIESRYSDFLTAQRYVEAANEIEKLVPFESKILGVEHPFIANTWANQADCWISAENYEAADKAAKKAFAIRRKVLGAKHPHTAMAAFYLAKALINQEKHEAALEYLELAAKVWRATGNLVDAAWMDSSRGDSLAALDRPSDAATAYKYAAAQFTGLNEHANAGYTHTELALLLQKQNKPFKAAEEFRLAASEHDRAGTPLEPFTCLLRSAELFAKALRYDESVKALSDSSRYAGAAAKVMSEEDLLEELKSVISKILPLLENESFVVKGLEAWSRLTGEIGSEQVAAGPMADALLSLQLKFSKTPRLFNTHVKWRIDVVGRWKAQSRVYAFLIQRNLAESLDLGRSSKLSSIEQCCQAYDNALRLGEGEIGDKYQPLRAKMTVDASAVAEDREAGGGLRILEQNNALLLKHLKGRSLWLMYSLRSKWLIKANRQVEGVADFFAAVDVLEAVEDATDVEIRDSLKALAFTAMNANAELPIDAAEKRARRRLIIHLTKMDDSASQMSEVGYLWLRLHQGGRKKDAEKALEELFSIARSFNNGSATVEELRVATRELSIAEVSLETSGFLGPAYLSCELALELSEKLPKSESIGVRVEFLGKQLKIAISMDQKKRIDILSAKLKGLSPLYLAKLSRYAEGLPTLGFSPTSQHSVSAVMSCAGCASLFVLKPVVDEISTAVVLAGELDTRVEQISGLMRKQDGLDGFAGMMMSERVHIWKNILQRLATSHETLPKDMLSYVELMKANALKARGASGYTDFDSFYAELNPESLEDLTALATKLGEYPMILERDVAVQIILLESFKNFADGKYKSVIEACKEAAGMLEQFVLRTGGPPQEMVTRSQRLRSSLDPYTFGLMASTRSADLNTAFEFAARGRSLGGRIAWHRTRDLSNLLAGHFRPAWLPTGGHLKLEEEYSAVAGLGSEGKGLPNKALGDQIASVLKPNERYILISTLHGTLAGNDHESSLDIGLFFIRPKTHPKPGIQFFERGTDSAVANESVPTEGVYVINVVTDSAAFQMGIRPGDIIQKVSGIAVTPDILPEELRKTFSESNIAFKVYRDGDVIELIRVKPAKSLGVLFSEDSPREAERQSREITSPMLAESRAFQVASLSNRGWSTRSSRSAKLIESDDTPLLSTKGESWRLFNSLFPADVWEELKSVRKVYLSVPGQLTGLPLETLVVEPPTGNSSEEDTVRWIDVGPQIVYLPFASVIPVDQDTEVQPAKLAYLGIGDVDFTSVEGVELPRLPNTRREVESISQVFKNEPAKVLLGPDASEESLFDIAPEARIISIATHGQYKDGLDTLETSVVLGATATRGDSEIPDQRRNGTLTLRDLLTDWRGRLPATELTILSACQTGGGLVTQEDGTVGLPFGFLAAGSDAVIASQWPVDDARTADLFSEMFSNRGNEEDMLSAFTRARRKLRAQHPDPHYWAPFVYISSH